MIIYIVLLLFLVGVVASVANYASFVRIYFQQTGKYIGQIADQAALNINSYLQEITRLCLSPYYDVQVMRAIETPGEDAQDFLARKRLIEGYLEQVMTIPRSDVISVHILSDEIFGVSRSYDTAVPSAYKDQWWYKQALEDDGYIFLPGNGNRMFSTIHRLRSIDNPNKVIGVIKVDANFSGIQDIFDRITLDDASSIDIRDSEGGILYRKSTLADDVAFERLQRRVGLALYLDEEALLEAARAQSGRVEVLDDFQDFLQLLYVGLHAGIDGQLVADAVQRLAQQSVVVQRPDEVFRQLALVVRQVLFAQLLFQSLVERRRVREGDFLGFLVAAAVVLLQLIVGDVVFAQVVAQRIIVRVAPVFGAFVARFGRVGIVVGRRVLLALFQGGILQQLGAHAVFHLHGRQF